jgi:hypothetical protein
MGEDDAADSEDAAAPAAVDGLIGRTLSWPAKDAAAAASALPARTLSSTEAKPFIAVAASADDSASSAASLWKAQFSAERFQRSSLCGATALSA